MAALSLVFLPPGGGDVSGWGPPMEALSKRYKSLAVDMPGAGSQRASKFLNTIEECAAYAEGALWASGLQNVVLMGFSMGGLIAQCMALRGPQAYRGLVLVATAARIKIAQQVLDALRADPAAARRMIQQSTHNPNLRQQAATGASNPEALHAYLNATNSYDAREQIKQIAIPTLIAHGDVDNVCPQRFAESVHQSIAGSQFKLFKGAGHELPREFPQELTSAIEEFLGRLAR